MNKFVLTPTHSLPLVFCEHLLCFIIINNLYQYISISMNSIWLNNPCDCWIWVFAMILYNSSDECICYLPSSMYSNTFSIFDPISLHADEVQKVQSPECWNKYFRSDFPAAHSFPFIMFPHLEKSVWNVLNLTLIFYCPRVIIHYIHIF